MGRIRVLLALALVSAVLMVSAVPSMAGRATANEVRVGVEPSTAGPGDAVTVLSTCGGGTVSSGAFGSTDLVELTRDDRYTSGATAVVENGTDEGVYDVEVTCKDGRYGMTELVVSGSGVDTGGGAMAGGMDRSILSVGVLMLLAAALGFAALRWRRSAG